MPITKPTSGRVDGTVRIGTQVETSGFNAGIKKLSTSAKATFSSLLLSVGRVASVLKTIIGIVAGIALGFLTLVLVITRFGSELFETLKKGIDKTSAYYKLITQLEGAFNTFKGSILSLFATLLVAVLPILTTFVNWLTNIIDKVNMVVAALLGQNTVLKAIVKTTNEQKKAQQGVLAAFDQINVLQKAQADQAPDTNPLTFESVPITGEALSIAQRIRDVLATVFSIWGMFVKAWNDFWKNSPIADVIKKLWANFVDTFARIYATVVQTWENIKASAMRIFTGIAEIVAGIFRGDWTLIFKGVKDVVEGTFSLIYNIISGTLTAIGILIDGWVKSVQILFEPLSKWFMKVWDDLKKNFTEVIDTLSLIWANFWNGIKLLAKSAINVVIDFINGMIGAMVSGINSVISSLNSIHVDIPEWIPVFGGQSFGLAIPSVKAPKIPRLAEGAVIPPNAQFLAMLGDQRSGTNIETPENLLRQLIREELSGGSTEVTVTIPVTLDGEKVYQNQKRVSLRHGKSLLSSGVV